MQTSESACHLARIEPIDPQESGRVLSFGWKLLLNATLLLMPVAMVGLFVPILGLAVLIGSSKSLLVAAVAIPLIFAVQIAWAGTYPEWPMNQLLAWRLRRACLARLDQRLDGWIRQARMVEWVPRENWSATKLDTAEDVMLIRVDDRGVELQGDFAHYVFPSGSIIDAAVESIRPTGCFHRLFFVVVTVRTDQGPLEFPLSFRDHRLGALRACHRDRQTHHLCQQIRAIATGGDVSFRDPDLPVYSTADAAYSGSQHSGSQHSGSQHSGSQHSMANPYAAPRAL